MVENLHIKNCITNPMVNLMEQWMSHPWSKWSEKLILKQMNFGDPTDPATE